MFSALILLFFSSLVRADIGYSLDIYGYLQKYSVADSVLNPSNRILQLPHTAYDFDVRGELKWRSGLNQAVVRPRMTWENKVVKEPGGADITDSKSKIDLSDAYLEFYLNNQLSVTSGLQIYQWGPAELLNPSNPIFHFNSGQKSLIFKEKGKVLIRANYTFDKLNSLVVIAEPISNGELPWMAESSFSPKFLIKYERLVNGTSDQIGITAGIEEQSVPFAGQYFSWSPTDGFSVYADIKEAQRKYNFTPQPAGVFTDLIEADTANPQLSTLAIAGVRWEGDFDVRAEYIYNSAGFDRDELEQALLAAANPLNPNYLRNLQRFQKIGLELVGRQYAYFSYRINEPFKVSDFNVYARVIVSGQDNSSQSQFEIDKTFRDAFLVFVNFSAASGDLDSEFRLLNDWQGLAGLKWGF